MIRAFEPVRCQADWQRPKNAGSNWKSKIAWDAARAGADISPELKSKWLGLMSELESIDHVKLDDEEGGVGANTIQKFQKA